MDLLGGLGQVAVQMRVVVIVRGVVSATEHALTATPSSRGLAISRRKIITYSLTIEQCFLP